MWISYEMRGCDADREFLSQAARVREYCRSLGAIEQLAAHGGGIAPPAGSRDAARDHDPRGVRQRAGCSSPLVTDYIAHLLPLPLAHRKPQASRKQAKQARTTSGQRPEFVHDSHTFHTSFTINQSLVTQHFHDGVDVGERTGRRTGPDHLVRHGVLRRIRAASREHRAERGAGAHTRATCGNGASITSTYKINLMPFCRKSISSKLYA